LTTAVLSIQTHSWDIILSQSTQTAGKKIYIKKKYPFIPLEIRSRGQKLTVTKTNKIKIENGKDTEQYTDHNII
jgi:hypothetical protein